MTSQGSKSIKVYPTFTYACGPKMAIVFIVLHGLNIMLFFQLASTYLSAAFQQEHMMIFAGIVSLLAFVALEMVCSILFIKKISKPLIFADDYILIPPWALHSLATRKHQHSLKLSLNEVNHINIRLVDPLGLLQRYLPRIVPIPMLVYLKTERGVTGLKLNHVGNFEPVYEWLNNMKPHMAISNNGVSFSLREFCAGFDDISKVCFGTSLFFATAMPLMLWVFTP
ncbi:hypothetical protein QWY20_15460 [Alkalimonas sp. MEB108]|uniref:Uncharacterized protein n=1 Tax=Alkalimonas cellulosilytica TaxID=3058395 RepID=A0ABU7JA47_9GAMM|nr:hypothetical protein [Alkalimonas sp. MEB108]MEE2002857.1 hypothetical protein [Alkalimonas sp. MEB108]